MTTPRNLTVRLPDGTEDVFDDAGTTLSRWGKTETKTIATELVTYEYDSDADGCLRVYRVALHGKSVDGEKQELQGQDRGEKVCVAAYRREGWLSVKFTPGNGHTERDLDQEMVDRRERRQQRASEE